MTARMLKYRKIDSPIHRLTGAAKLLFFALWSVTAMITYDTRCLLAMLVLGIGLFVLSRVPYRDYAFVLALILLFFLLNHLAIFLFSPQEGVKLYGTKHVWLPIAGQYVVTAEQVFYQCNVALKYAAVIPIALLFILTTNPSEFAASLNRVGISYRIAYAVSIALRYIPDVQRDYQNISFAAGARGLDISRNERLGKRIRNLIAILMPLILSSIERIEIISSAMELRGFGRKQTRTWYHAQPFGVGDYIAMALIAVIITVVVWMTAANGSRFYNIFI
ncbi:energy-coupling factor transporter transmembrane component T family protein [Paenibacillus sp. GCM10023252]|uniref:energy-coupling factor transporter transmembrane component T family protein n=1 Tax=Paenibacillus sp. GCM10023252 TaxID=3252649 RepID=UPI00361814D9